uniref:SUMO interacting motifs containing 1 n=1 Tax=Latimeria chalumnae TaxID=7897 RepID=H3B404_LATCH
IQRLLYFRTKPVHHLFFKRRRCKEQTACKPKLISQRRQTMINSTIEENFPQGTLQFLTDFVSAQHYPPKEMMSHVIRKILLSSEAPSIITEAYTLLMKVQQLHPASASTLPWNWELLASNMAEKAETFSTRLLFLQYVVQTLEDDFKLKLKSRSLHNSIAKKVLSCDTTFTNVKHVITWLIEAIEISDNRKVKQLPLPSESIEAFKNMNLRLDLPNFYSIQYSIGLLQKMLALAVEVDRSPTCSSIKIAEVMLQEVLNITSRHQREILLASVESDLLRCKLLEDLFSYSSEKPQSMTMSLGKILHFLKYSKILFETEQGKKDKWLNWDEMLDLLCSLLQSYQEVNNGHLRHCVTERMKHILGETPPLITQDDKITAAEIKADTEFFYKKVSHDLGGTVNPLLETKINLLKSLLSASRSNKN